MTKTLTNLFRRLTPAKLPQFKPVLNSEISPENRQKLRDWLRLPETVLALSVLESTRPSVFVGLYTGTSPEINAQRSMQRLHQLQGWQAALNTLLTLERTPQEIKELQETFSKEL